MIALEAVRKAYPIGGGLLPVLKGVTLTVQGGEFLAIMGPSGSGKTTLLNLMGCLDSVDQGSYCLAGKPVHDASDEELASLRNQHLGFVFQLFNLIPRISAERNVELPLVYAGVRPAERRHRAIQALERVGIAERTAHLPSQLSGGQQQRVAIARALVNDPDVIVADEPTGSLDSRTGREIMEVFRSLNAAGTTIVMVTHEADIAAFAGRTIHMLDGEITQA